MPDLVGLTVRRRRSDVVPPGFDDWDDYRVPLPAADFSWEDLVAIGAANGLVFGHELVLKWRQWRFLPAPRPGGSTGRGPGRSQRWSYEAAIRTAWLSRWQYDTLTYDVLRLAMWPFTPEIERDRPAEVRKSIAAFLGQDEDFHARKVMDDAD